MPLYRKGGPSLLDLGQAMIEEVAGWLPDRHFLLGCNGAYAPLAGRELPRTHVVSPPGHSLVMMACYHIGVK